MRWTIFARVAAIAALGSVVIVVRSDAAPVDVAARGVDLFLHAPREVASGAALELDVEALGFPTVTTLAPLAGAEVEASWDPESLGDDATRAPPAVRATADASGRARLVVPVPPGDPRELSLLVAARAGSHERVRALKVRRTLRSRVAIHVVDRRVVPGGMASAWVLVTNAVTGAPAPNVPLEISLLEGGSARETLRATSDAAGTAAVRVHVPRTDQPAWSWLLRASAIGAVDSEASAGVELTPREETPGAPRVDARFEPTTYRAGERATYRVRLRDATDQPLAGAPLRLWVGPRGTHPPKDDKAWARVPPVVTDARGEVSGTFDAPRNVMRGAPTSLELVARARVEGNDIEAKASAVVGETAGTAELLLEAGAVVPGVEQRGLLRLRNARGEPIAGAFHVEAEGLAEDVTTDAHGEVEITWRPPGDVGARRSVGPCAGGIAATVHVRPRGSFAFAEPFDVCAIVDRDAPGLLLVDHALARVGDRIHVSVRTRDPREKNDAWSVVLSSDDGAHAVTTWIDDGEKGADVIVPEGAPGRFSVSAASPSTTRAALTISRAILVAPRVLGELGASVAGRAAPGGFVDVDAALDDGKGHALTGTVAAMLVDRNGGGTTAGLDAFDTRGSLCSHAGVDRDRCRAFFDGDASLEPLRRAATSGEAPRVVTPLRDPAAAARREMDAVFAGVVKSLEGAVFEASASPELARDVRRKDARGYAFNPELLTLVTAAMDTPPTTPGGEPVALSDLLAIDKQVTFDVVARRVARLKLFRVLDRVRVWRRELSLDPDEPIFRDPNAILRRLVREGRLTEDELVDPWGGTFAFTRAVGPPAPFLTVVRGYELHAPGPDGVLGTGDDVKDPFERVLRSGTPYAIALHEDRLVDAKLDAEIADSTVSSWDRMFSELTGTKLGLTGTGEGGGGRGEGIGLGSIGTIGHGSGHGRLSSGFAFGEGSWSTPVRTDARGHARLRLQLGDAETTWRVALVAIPDTGGPATTSVDVPAFLPFSVRVDAGARWIAGDVVDAKLVVRNRTEQRAHLSIACAAAGAIEVAGAASASRFVDVPARGAAELTVRLRAKRAGEATLGVELREGDKRLDRVDHTWNVEPPSEATALTEAKWIARHEALVAPIERGMVIAGAPRVVIERGYEPSLGEALESLEPDKLTTPDAAADAIEVASRIHRFAVNRGGESSDLAVRAVALRDRARGRLLAFDASGAHPSTLGAKARAVMFGGDRDPTAPHATSCPPDVARSARVPLLEVEPMSNGTGVALACWDAFVSTTLTDVEKSGDPLLVAEALLAVSERAHRIAAAAALADRLREIVALRPSGAITLAPVFANSRAARAIVFAALLRAEPLGKRRVASADRLAAWTRVQEGADGGYGSAEATRAVVRALLAAAPATRGPSTITITTEAGSKTVKLDGAGRLVVPLEASATHAEIAVEGAPVLARLERPAARLWSAPPDASLSAIQLEATWPGDARAGGHGVLRLSVRHGFETSTTLDLKVPLPPGVDLAAPVEGVRQIQGALFIRRAVDASLVPSLVEIPVRYALSGAFTVPESSARPAFEEAERAIAPARPFLIR